MNTDFDLIIVGGGLVGAALALALEDSGLKLALVERGEPSSLPQDASWDPRIYAISPTNATFLESLGAWQVMDRSRLQPVAAMHVWGDDGAACLDFGAYETGVPELAFIAESRLMADGLWQRMQQQDNLEIVAPAVCAALDWYDDYAMLRLEDGRELTTKLVVGADGRESWVRRQAGIEAKPRPYGQKGVVANFNIEKPHRGAALQWFREDGILAYLPLPGNRMSMVWSTWDAHADALTALPAEELCQRVAEAGRHALGKLELITPAAGFSLRLLNIGSLVKPRMALVGDAAHNVHPLAGYGVNLGFQDVMTLAEVLQERGPEKDCGDYRLLRRYDRARQEDIAAMQLTTDSLQKLFNNGNPLLKAARNFGLSLTNRQGWLKKALIRHALGYSI